MLLTMEFWTMYPTHTHLQLSLVMLLYTEFLSVRVEANYIFFLLLDQKYFLKDRPLHIIDVCGIPFRVGLRSLTSPVNAG